MRRAALALPAGLLAFFLTCATVGAGGGGIPSGNLLANQNAEQGQAATNETDRFDPPGWQVGAGTSVTAVRYGTTTFPTAADSTLINGGSAFFAGGPGTSTAPQLIFQIVNVATAGPAIDAG